MLIPKSFKTLHRNSICFTKNEYKILKPDLDTYFNKMFNADKMFNFRIAHSVLQFTIQAGLPMSGVVYTIIGHVDFGMHLLAAKVRKINDETCGE